MLFIIGYPEFGFHLNQTGKHMIYSCSWPVYQIYAGMQVSNDTLYPIYFFQTIFTHIYLLFSRIILQLQKIVIFGATLMTFRTRGLVWRVSSITMVIIKT